MHNNTCSKCNTTHVVQCIGIVLYSAPECVPLQVWRQCFFDTSDLCFFPSTIRTASVSQYRHNSLINYCRWIKSVTSHSLYMYSVYRCMYAFVSVYLYTCILMYTCIQIKGLHIFIIVINSEASQSSCTWIQYYTLCAIMCCTYSVYIAMLQRCIKYSLYSVCCNITHRLPVKDHS